MVMPHATLLQCIFAQSVLPHPYAHDLYVSLVNSMYFDLKRKTKQTDHLSLSMGMFSPFASNVITDKLVCKPAVFRSFQISAAALFPAPPPHLPYPLPPP